MARLYLRIYLAVLASLALFALLAATTWFMLRDHERFGPRPEFLRAVAERIAPPADAPIEAQRRILEDWRQLGGFDVAILSAEGNVIVEAGDASALIAEFGIRRDRDGRVRPWRGPPWLQLIPLADGRWLMASPPLPERGPLRRFGWLAALVGIALAVAIAAYPIVRRLTRRLETLQRSVAALGQGDLSARVKVEGKDEIGRLAETFNRTADRIQTLVTANRSLLANASHELRSPLARLRMGIESLGIESLGSGPEGSRRRDELARNIRELDQLIEEILLASRLDGAGAMAMRTEPVDVVALLAEECSAADAALDLRTPGLPVINGDQRLLRRLVRNLIENAERHGGGRPEVSLAKAGEQMLKIAVADRGPGVPESERTRIFEPFYRSKGASESAGGVGLGLALVRQIAERHGGSVSCEAREGGGSIFQVMLPSA
ncbi:MAG: HAMP domain-containing histidine kinase [Methylocystis sp.]|jgi:signal transduction histidine kinase|nr:HAMP domain-containing histidine kinase [Methylocystis sp.]MCA3585014.1 HAMP domain-containing histidine kinase [Methylocystis sp.]MCA3586944.1 HAMP domain-containing histidine kinase [Methylocystis sp.]MCA3592232.1 HAMP domain-containing histidine kinase [Methylocystis sp.]